MKTVNQETGVYRIKETENSAEKSGNGKFQNKQPCTRLSNQLIHTGAGEWRTAGGKSVRDQKSRKFEITCNYLDNIKYLRDLLKHLKKKEKTES